MTGDRHSNEPASSTESAGQHSSANAIVEADETTWALRDVLRGYSATNIALGRTLNLSLNDLSALEHLLDDGADLGPVELGHRLGIRSASATAMVDRLEQAGHLQRKAHPTDRRRRVLAVTDSATNQLMNALGPVIGDLAAISAGLTEAERAAVDRYLKNISAVLWKHAPER